MVAVGFVRISKHKLHLPVPEKYSFGPDDREDVSLYKKNNEYLRESLLSQADRAKVRSTKSQCVKKKK